MLEMLNSIRTPLTHIEKKNSLAIKNHYIKFFKHLILDTAVTKAYWIFLYYNYCVFQPVNACLPMCSHGRKQRKMLENYKKVHNCLILLKNIVKRNLNKKDTL